MLILLKDMELYFHSNNLIFYHLEIYIYGLKQHTKPQQLIAKNRITHNYSLFEQNHILEQIHDELDTNLLKLGVKQHDFDKKFIFHSTLFMDENIDKIKSVMPYLKHVRLSAVNLKARAT